MHDHRPFFEGRCRCIRRCAAHAGQDNGWVEEIISEGLRLGAHFARPSGTTRVPALLVLPGFPRGPGGAATVGNTDQVLCDRIAREAGWAGLTFTFRGTGPSEGDFSIEGWLADVRAAVDALHARPDITGVWVAGFRLGGTLAIVTAATDDRVRGISTFAAPGVAFDVGARSAMVHRIRASHRCAAHRGLSLGADELDPRHREPRSGSGRGADLSATVVADARHGRRRRAARTTRAGWPMPRRLRRGPDRRQRRAPAPSRPACDRRVAGVARPSGTLRARARTSASTAASVSSSGISGSPTGRGVQPAVVADQHRDFGRSHETGVELDAQWRVGVGEEIGGDSAIRDALTAAHVVHLAGRAVVPSAAGTRARCRGRR